LGDFSSDDEPDDEDGHTEHKHSTSICDDDDSAVAKDALDMETFCFCEVTDDNKHGNFDNDNDDDNDDDDDDDDDDDNGVIVDSVEQESEAANMPSLIVSCLRSQMDSAKTTHRVGSMQSFTSSR